MNASGGEQEMEIPAIEASRRHLSACLLSLAQHQASKARFRALMLRMSATRQQHDSFMEDMSVLRRRNEEVRDQMLAVRAALQSYVRGLRADNEPPEHVLVLVKNAVRGVMDQSTSEDRPPDSNWMMDETVSLAVETYFAA